MVAITVIATPGASNANSFQTVAEIDEYYAGRVPESVRDEWLDADSSDKAAAAVMATRWMTALISWNGFPTSLDQPLPWPRNSMETRNGWSWVDNDIIPLEIKIAHAEFSRILLKADRLEESDVVKEGIIGLKAGPVSLTFRDNLYTQPQVIPQFVLDFLVPSWIDQVYSQLTGNRELRRA